MSSVFNEEEVSLIRDIHSNEDSVKTWMGYAARERNNIENLQSEITTRQGTLQSHLKMVKKFEDELVEMRKKLSTMVMRDLKKLPVSKTASKIQESTFDSLESRS